MTNLTEWGPELEWSFRASGDVVGAIGRTRVVFISPQ